MALSERLIRERKRLGNTDLSNITNDSNSLELPTEGTVTYPRRPMNTGKLSLPTVDDNRMTSKLIQPQPIDQIRDRMSRGTPIQTRTAQQQLQTRVAQQQLQTRVGGTVTTPAQQQLSFTLPETTEEPEPEKPKSPASDLQVAADRVTQEMLSGRYAEGLQTQMSEASARGIANIRAGTAQQVAAAGLIGQGAGQQAMKGVEQFAVQEASRNALMAQIAGQEAKERGVAAATQRGYLGVALRNQQVNEGMQQIQGLVNAGDFDAAASTWRETFGSDIDMSRFKDIQAMNDYFTSASDVAQMIELGKNVDDPEVAARLQKMWTQQGGTGTPPKSWAQDTYEGIAVAGNEFDYALAQIERSEYLSDEDKRIIRQLLVSGWNGKSMGMNFVTGVDVQDAQGNVVATFDNQSSANAYIQAQDDTKNYRAVQGTETRLTFLDPLTGKTYGGFGTYQTGGGGIGNNPETLKSFADRMADVGVEVDLTDASKFFQDTGNEPGVIDNTTSGDYEAWLDTQSDTEDVLGILNRDSEYEGVKPDGAESKMMSALLNNEFAEKIQKAGADERETLAKEAGFYSYAQYERVKAGTKIPEADWGFGDRSGENPTMVKSSKKGGGTGQGIMSLIAGVDGSVYTTSEGSKGFPLNIKFNDETRQWIEANKGSKITLDLGYGKKEYWIDSNEPIVKRSKGTWAKKGFEKTKEGLRVMDISTGKWEIIEWSGTWWGADAGARDSMKAAEDKVNIREFELSGGKTSRQPEAEQISVVDARRNA